MFCLLQCCFLRQLLFCCLYLRHVKSTLVAEEHPTFHVTACLDVAAHPTEVCLTVHFDNTSADVGAVTMVCRVYTESQHTPQCVDEYWLANSSSSKCPNTKLPCNVRVTGLLRDTTYYAFCSGWHKWPHFFQVQPQCLDRDPACGVIVHTADQSGPGTHIPFSAINCASTLLVVIYILWSFLFERIRILHETGMAVLAGLLVGYCVKWMYGETAQFSYDTFSFFLLPAVIYAAGFNLRKKGFFRYSAYIMSLGVLGTIMIFFFIYYASSKFEFVNALGQGIPLKPQSRLIMASVLASTDSVAPMAFLPAQAFPRLFAVVFGEGVLNDVVSILLSTAVAQSPTLPTSGSLALNVLIFFSTSFGMGAIFGLGASLLFRMATPLQAGTVKPCALLALINYLCYVSAEMCQISSIFALFISALISRHYASHWLEPKAREFAEEFAELLSYCAEAFVFGYFGLTAVSHLTKGTYSVGLILCYLACVFIARFFTITLLVLFLWLSRCCHRLSLTCAELAVIGLAGCMRGTIAYALILRSMPRNPSPQQETLISTILFIVLVNAVLTGGLFPLVLKLLGITAEARTLSEENALDLSRDSGVLPSQYNVRNHVHSWWHFLDASYLKPVFRPTRQPTGSDAEEPSRREAPFM